MKAGTKINVVLIALALLLAFSGVAVAKAPVEDTIILPPNQSVTVRCIDGDELIATIWDSGEWALECRQYVTAEK